MLLVMKCDFFVAFVIKLQQTRGHNLDLFCPQFCVVCIRGKLGSTLKPLSHWGPILILDCSF